MYLLSREVTLEWELLKTATPPTLGDLDLIYIDPLGGSTYVVAPLLPENYTPPTSTTSGTVSTTFTPELEGLWRIRLVTGTSSSYRILAKMEMFVFDSSNVTAAYSEEIGKDIPYDINFFMPGLPSTGEVYGSIAITRPIVLGLNAPGSVALCEVPGAVANSTYNIVHNGVQIGSVVFAVGALVGTVTCASTLLSIGDKLQVVVSNAVDTALEDVTVNLVGCCTVIPCSV